MKVLITGGSSLLGKALTETKPENIQLESTWYTNYTGIDHVSHQLDITDKSQVGYIFNRVQPDIVIHCAAIGSVDYAESHYQEVKEVNLTGTENILAAANDYSAKVVFITTNAIFRGTSSPYGEHASRNPVNLYGKMKVQAENRVMDSRNWLVIRPFLLYGWPCLGGRQNWATSVINSLKDEIPALMVDDVIWQPTYVNDCAETIWKLLEANREIYHVASAEKATLYNFALKVAKVFELNAALIQPVHSDHFKLIAKRPKNTTYSLNKLTGLGIKLSDIESGLEKMKASENK